MTKFDKQFEFHKIPEWYNQYLDYKQLNLLIKQFKTNIDNNTVMKVPGFYLFTKKKAVIPMDIFKRPG